jgi:hypothetical protein
MRNVPLPKMKIYDAPSEMDEIRIVSEGAMWSWMALAREMNKQS